jgi:HrpA-like RNA helicase
VLDENRTYIGARDARFVIAPGTPLAKRPPRWIVAASLLETQRLYARTVAQVQPSWIESAGAHLVRRTYGDAPPGTLVALVGSQGFIEAAVVQESAASRLAAGVGTSVAMPAGRTA